MLAIKESVTVESEDEDNGDELYGKNDRKKAYNMEHCIMFCSYS